MERRANGNAAKPARSNPSTATTASLGKAAEEPPTATPTSMQSDANKATAQQRATALQQEATHLLQVLRNVSATLSAHTSKAAAQTAEQTEVTQMLAVLLQQACGREGDGFARQSADFLARVREVSEECRVLGVLAGRTSEVRAKVLALERQVAEL